MRNSHGTAQTASLSTQGSSPVTTTLSITRKSSLLTRVWTIRSNRLRTPTTGPPLIFKEEQLYSHYYYYPICTTGNAMLVKMQICSYPWIDFGLQTNWILGVDLGFQLGPCGWSCGFEHPVVGPWVLGPLNPHSHTLPLSAIATWRLDQNCIFHNHCFFSWSSSSTWIMHLFANVGSISKDVKETG
jgi:hypothetical protein